MALESRRQIGSWMEGVMSTTYLDRRQLLKGLGAGALAVGAAATLSPATALADDDHKGLVGGWNINVHPAGEPDFRAVATFAPGGVMGTTDSRVVGAGFGVWKQQEDNTFAFKFTVFDFRQGAPGVTVVVSVNATVSGNSLQGTLSVTVFGTVVGGGTIDGTRMTV
jgi:hypothetical protein